MLRSVTARDYMSDALVTLQPGMDVLEAVDLLLEFKISGAPVVDEDHELVGMLSEADCLKTVLSATYHNDLGANVEDVMTTTVDTIDANSSIVEVAEYFLSKHRRRLPVVEDGRVIGQISRRDVLAAFQKFTDPRAR